MAERMGREPMAALHATLVAGALAALLAPGAAGAGEAEPSILDRVLENTIYEAETVVSLYPRPPDQARSEGIENEDFEAWTHLSADSDTFLNDYWTLGIGLEALASTYRGAEQGLFTKPGGETGQARYIDFSRLTLTYLGDVTEVMVGKDDVPIGVAEIYSPSDLYGRQNSANPQHGVDFGVWQLRADAYLDGGDRLTGIVLPVEENAPGASDSSRWGGNGGDDFAAIEIPGLPPGFETEIEEKVRGVSGPTDWGYLLQYKGTATGMDYFATAFNGPGPFPVLKAPPPGQLNPYDKVRPRVTIVSAGAALTEGSWKLYAEGLGYWAMRNRDDDLARGLIGAKYRETRFANSIGLDEIAPVVEYAREWRLDRQGDPGYVASSEKARPNRNNILASLTVTVDSEWTVGAAYNRSLKADDNLANAFVRFEPNDNLEIALSGYRYEGPENSLFGRYDRNDNVEISVGYSF